MAHHNTTKRDSWIMRMYKKYKTFYFLPLISDSEVRLNGFASLFVDIANFNVSIEEEGHLFLNPQFMAECISAAEYKRDFWRVTYNALNHYSTYCHSLYGHVDVLTNDATKAAFASFDVYNDIVLWLNAIQQRGDPHILIDMGHAIEKRKKNIR